MNKGLLGTLVLGSTLGLIGCGLEAQGRDGEAILPEADEGQGSTHKGDGYGLEIDELFDATAECHVDACFEISAEHALDFIAIGGDIDASAVTLFEIGENGTTSFLDLDLELLADLGLSLGSDECGENLTDDCLGVDLGDLLGTTRLMVCIELDVTADVPEIVEDATVDVDVFASANSTCYTESFAIAVDAECTVEGDGDGNGGGGDGCYDSQCGGDGDGGSDGGSDGGEQCLLDEVLCDGLCVDLDVDLLNCGACGNICDVGQCILGECVL